MISRKIYINILARVLLIVVFAFLMAFAIVSSASVRLSLLCLAAMLFSAFSLASYLNNTNKKIKLFFDSVSNDDTSLVFSSKGGDRSMKELERSIENVNRQIRKLRRDAEEKEQYMGILLEHLATGIITFDNKGFIVHSNAAARKLLSLSVLTHVRQIERTNGRLYSAINGIKPFERRVAPVNTAAGPAELSIKAASFSIGGREMVILSLQDIKHELDEREVESWMKLIRVLMHEIMNSITPVASLSESLSRLLRKENEDISPGDVTPGMIATLIHGLEVISDQGKGLMAFVESYRKLSRLPEPERTLFSVSTLFSRAKVLFDSLGASGVTLTISNPAEDIKILADQNLICQVLINLFRNAVEACKGRVGAEIILKAAMNDLGHPEICVSDNGPGIPGDLIDNVFVPFFTTRQSGTGIGLSISRQIMKIHGGSLKVRSVPDVETVFCLGF
ncbi:MAG: ATP-binding protein [Bacteroidales bacterium]|jgi:nitrogen fixation/metabolism regulation signal transduction histidine kinase|nr:ATP-binding protein [Bacteroidales bacterium]